MLEAFYKPLLAKAIEENTCNAVAASSTDVFILSPAVGDCCSFQLTAIASFHWRSQHIVIVWKSFKGGNSLRMGCAGLGCFSDQFNKGIMNCCKLLTNLCWMQFACWYFLSCFEWKNVAFAADNLCLSINIITSDSGELEFSCRIIKTTKFFSILFCNDCGFH